MRKVSHQTVSLDAPPPPPTPDGNDEVTSKKRHNYDVLSRARSKLYNLGDVIRAAATDHHPRLNFENFFARSTLKPSSSAVAAATDEEEQQLERLVYVNRRRASSVLLQKQNSVGAYPVSRMQGGEELRSPTGDPTEALALERPRKKLSFREPEISGYSSSIAKRETFPRSGVGIRKTVTASNGILHKASSFEELESQAMRVVRTIGQAFEVCHKLSINSPGNENHADDQDDLDTSYSQDMISDRLSDNSTADQRIRKDLTNDYSSARLTPPPSDKNVPYKNSLKHIQLDTVSSPPPTNTTNSTVTKSTLATTENQYSSPQSELHSGNLAPPPNSTSSTSTTLSTQHELQLLKEQLEQQNQQTHAALAQLQLTKEQLAAEQSARMEAQTRIQQLLVHNRELLDHIASLVAHLQGSDKNGQPPPTASHVTIPQLSTMEPPPQQKDPRLSTMSANPQYDPAFLQSSNLNLSRLNLMDNRNIGCLQTPSPLRTPFNSSGFFTFSPPSTTPGSSQMDPAAATLAAVQYETAQFLQRLQSNYATPQYVPYMSPTPTYYCPPLPPAPPPPPPTLPPVLTNNYAIPTTKPPHSGSTLRRNLERRSTNGGAVVETPPPAMQHQDISRSQVEMTDKDQFIKPLSQIGTLTATDAEGRLRVIVPVASTSSSMGISDADPNSSTDDYCELRVLSAQGDDEFRGAPITRSTSEKLPKGSDLMNQVQRTLWARHTTK